MRAAVARALAAETNGKGAQLHRVNLAEVVLNFAEQIGNFADAGNRPVDFGVVASTWEQTKADAAAAATLGAEKWTPGDEARLEIARAVADCQRRIRAAYAAHNAARKAHDAADLEGLPE